MNLSVEKFLRNFFDKYYWRQHPEAALRYSPIVSEIKKAKLENAKILEIGPGSLGVIPYLKTKIDGIDVDFSGPKTQLLSKIKGKATELPFRKNTYDVSISVDVLEHLKKEERENAVLEMLRVTKKLALIVVPIGSSAEIQDRNLYDLWNKIHKVKNQYLLEHIENGLPNSNEILVQIDKSLRKLGKTAKVISYPNLNLTVRNLLMQTWITKNKYKYYLYLKGYLLLVPLLKLANFGKTYRRVFVIKFTS